MDQEQKLKNVEMLKRSVEEWNEWRAPKSERMWKDLRRVDLRGLDLREADLTDCDLRGADVTDADLRGARLIGVELSGLIGLATARLAGATLTPKQLHVLLAIIGESINTEDV